MMFASINTSANKVLFNAISSVFDKVYRKAKLDRPDAEHQFIQDGALKGMIIIHDHDGGER